MPENTEPEDINDELPEGGEQTSPIDQRQLADEAAKRRKELPLLQRIVKHFSKDRAVYRELVINAETLEKRVALLTNGVLDKFEIEHKGENRMVGAIFKGRVQNLEGGLKAAFVDIGQPKNAFLHYWDMLPAANDSQVEFIRDNESAEQKQRKARYQAKDIPQLFPAGSDIVIQVVKDQIGTKGPRSTTNIALPGRYLVLMPFSGACGVSRKIEESSERERLKDILRSLTIPEGMGVIIRTAGEGKQARWFVRDLHMLLKRWQAIVEKINAPDRRPVLLYQEPGLIERTVRDFLTEEVDRILVDNPEDFKLVQDLVGEVSPRPARASSFTRTPSRSSSAITSNARSSSSSSAASRSRAAARSSSTRPRPSRPSTSIPAATAARTEPRTATSSPRPTSRPSPRRPARSSYATSAASS
jgi:ribonuclease G